MRVILGRHASFMRVSCRYVSKTPLIFLDVFFTILFFRLSWSSIKHSGLLRHNKPEMLLVVMCLLLGSLMLRTELTKVIIAQIFKLFKYVTFLIQIRYTLFRREVKFVFPKSETESYEQRIKMENKNNPSFTWKNIR